MAFNIPELADGLGFATVAMGVFGFAEIIRNLDAGAEMDRDLVQQKITGLMPTKKDLIASAPAIVRGTILGSILRHPAGRRRGNRLVCGLYVREEDRTRIPHGSAAAPSKAWRRPKAPITRRRRPRSSHY